MARVGVVVLAYGARGVHQPLLRHLLTFGVDPSTIAIVHNPARRGERLPVREGWGVEVIEMEGNLGYAGGMNAGVRHHLERGAEAILLLTHDVRFRPGAVRALLDAAGTPGFGVLGPALFWRDEPFAYGGLTNSRGRAWLRRQVDAGCEGILPADWIEGSAMLVSAAVFAEVGMLDDRFFMYFEEVDFCLRAARAGWPSGVVLAAEAVQEPGFERRPATYSYLMVRNGLEHARRVAGGAGVAAGLARVLGDAVHHLRVWLGRRSEPDQRRQGRARLLGGFAGVAAFLGRRWGAAPPYVERWEGAA
jgi:GT2 family glycosyltransferase